MKHYDPIIEKIFDEKGKEMGLNVELQINPEVKDFLLSKASARPTNNAAFYHCAGKQEKFYAMISCIMFYWPYSILMTLIIF